MPVVVTAFRRGLGLRSALLKYRALAPLTLQRQYFEPNCYCIPPTVLDSSTMLPRSNLSRPPTRQISLTGNYRLKLHSLYSRHFIRQRLNIHTLVHRPSFYSLLYRSRQTIKPIFSYLHWKPCTQNNSPSEKKEKGKKNLYIKHLRHVSSIQNCPRHNIHFHLWNDCMGSL